MTVNQRLRLVRRARRAERGVTLFEVLIVVAILAMVAGGVAVFALPQWNKAQITTARTAAGTIRTAVHQWQASNPGQCPTVSQLVQDKIIDRGTNVNDPWAQPYTITCTEDDVVVISSGPDKQKGTKDDISVPEGSKPEP